MGYYLSTEIEIRSCVTSIDLNKLCKQTQDAHVLTRVSISLRTSIEVERRVAVLEAGK